MKQYAVVTDITPSEQITGDDSAIKTMGLVVGLREYGSFDRVGSKFPKKDRRFKLRKWSGSSTTYKLNAIEHARMLADVADVIFGYDAVSEANIKLVGDKMYQHLMGDYPIPVGHNSKGKPKHTMGGYKQDGVVVPRYDVLQDELTILGWYTTAITSFHRELLDINGEDVKLDVIADRLPLEQGGGRLFKAHLLKKMLMKASRNLINLAGVPEKPDREQRDLLVDNIAGMGKELVLRPTSNISKKMTETVNKTV